MVKIANAYSFWQYRCYTAGLGIFLFFKFLFVILGWTISHPALTIDIRFAAACGILLAVHIISAYGLIWSCLLAECAWTYIFFFISENAGSTDRDFFEFSFISLLVLLPVLVSLCTDKHKKVKQGISAWQMPAWLFYSAQIIFLMTPITWYFSRNYGSLGVMEFLLFLFIFDARRLAPKKVKKSKKPILFFDGMCILCGRWVNFILREDYMHIFRFSPLQGKTASRVLSPQHTKNIPGVVLYEKKDTIYTGSEAVLKTGHSLGGIWRLAALLGYCIPLKLRQNLYNYAAKNRYRWFTPLQKCPVSAPEEQPYFLN